MTGMMQRGSEYGVLRCLNCKPIDFDITFSNGYSGYFSARPQCI